MRFITYDERNSRAQAEKLSHAAEIERQVLVWSDAPIGQKLYQILVLTRRFGLAEAQRSIQKEKRAAAPFHKKFQSADHGSGIVIFRTCNHQHRATFGNFERSSCGRLTDSQRFVVARSRWPKSFRANFVIVALQNLFEQRVAAGVSLVDGMLPGGGEHAHGAFIGLKRADQCASEFFLAQALRAFAPRAAIDDNR